MNIGIVGLGLIGGSIAKAYKKHDGITVYGFDTDDSILGFAQISGAIDGVLNTRAMSVCDCILIAVSPGSAVEFLENSAPNISRDAIVFDCCGVKRSVCEKCFAIAKKHGFTFVGAHPMAGTAERGFKFSHSNLFKDEVIALVPPIYDDMELFSKIELLLKPVGFGKLTITTPDAHDDIIAFTSQLAHVVSNAYVKSPQAMDHKGLSAGSYKDLTRVARLNPDMWAELFVDNSEPLVREIEFLIETLKSYSKAIADKDIIKLRDMLAEGCKIKEEIDGR